MTVRAVPDMATLYSRAHVQGTRYGDFSASSKQVRGQFRLRIVRKQTDLGAQPPEVGQQQTRQEVQTPALPRSREGGAPRWYALQSVLTPDQIAAPPPIEPRPTLVVFSLAGGVGKTSLVANLGRALSALGEQVLLADTVASGLLPFYFGSRELRPGVVRNFSSPGPPSEVGANAPVQVLNLRTESLPGDSSQHDPLLAELVRDGRGANRILVDVATASREVASRLLLLRPTVLVPILPDMSSVASLALLEALLTGPASNPGWGTGSGKPLYLLNQFDDSSALHLDVRAMLQQQLGDRLLPFMLRRCSAVSEALAEGMTVIDYAPDSWAAEDYWNLAGWLRSFAAPAETWHGGPRWSEQ